MRYVLMIAVDDVDDAYAVAQLVSARRDTTLVPHQVWGNEEELTANPAQLLVLCRPSGSPLQLSETLEEENSNACTGCFCRALRRTDRARSTGSGLCSGGYRRQGLQRGLS